MAVNPGDRGVPIGAPKSWMEAANKQDGQCGMVTVGRGLNAKPVACTKTLRGGHKLYLWDDLLLCQQHFDKARKAPKPGEVITQPRKGGNGRDSMR